MTTDAADVRQPLVLPNDGETKVDETKSRWTACCSVWLSEDAWMPPQHEIERDPTLAAQTHRVVPAGTVNCPECGRSLRRFEPDAVDVAAVLAVVETRDTPTREASYAQRLRDTQEGTWIRFGPVTIDPGHAERILLCPSVPVEDVAFLALPASIAPWLRVLDVVVGRDSLVDGPIPGECFAVRIPNETNRPIDRGGSLDRRATIHPGVSAYVLLENPSNVPICVLGALFAPRASSHLSVVAGE